MSSLIGSTLGRISKPQWIYIALTAFVHTLIVILYASTRQDIPSQVSVMVLSSLLVLATVVSVVEVVLKERWKYIVALATHLLLAIAVTPFIAYSPVLEICVLSPLVLSSCLHNPFPFSLYAGLVSLSVIAAVQVLSLLPSPILVRRIIAITGDLVIIGSLLTLLSGYLIRFREPYIETGLENARLDGLVDRLSRANLEYQEYAKSIEEASTEAERKRITRDIHDIVGYTLTNNITMMEAITDIMRVNPLGVSRLVNSARDNAEEGLARVREALHILREQQVIYPKGLPAVERMITIFSRATGVAVEHIISQDQWVHDDDVEDAIYHVIQESMLNSFRHGRASRIRIFFARSNGSLELLVRDNGLSSEDIKEDIGLAGMRERVASLGGNLLAHSIQDGFEVRAEIPV